MRSPYSRSSRKRSPTSNSNRSRPRSASPSPPRPSLKSLRAIRITIGNVPGKILRGSKLTSRNNEPDFKGAEEDLPRSKEQKKIQIEIRRSIPSNRASNSPVRRSIRNPSTVYISRSHHEGKNPIFDRDDIKRFVPKVPEQRVIAIIPDNPRFDRVRSRSPLDRMHTKDDRKPVHDRLGGGDDRRPIHDRLGSSKEDRNSAYDRNSTYDRKSAYDRNNSLNDRDRKPAVYDRLGDANRVLDREEMEYRRPHVKPWEVNPESVPRSRYYFEHDNRENFQGFRGSYRGSFRGRGRGGGFIKRSRVDDGDWKHDKFKEVQEDGEP